jgi:hypothetical protein
MCFHPIVEIAKQMMQLVFDFVVQLYTYNGQSLVLGTTKAPQIEIVNKDQCFELKGKQPWL